jgi:hypothetical protein
VSDEDFDVRMHAALLPEDPAKALKVLADLVAFGILPESAANKIIEGRFAGRRPLVKATIVTSHYNPDWVSIRDEDGNDLRRALTREGFEPGDVVYLVKAGS